MSSRLPEAVSFSEAGSVERQVLELWNIPLAFLLLLLLESRRVARASVLGAAMSVRLAAMLLLALGAAAPAHAELYYLIVGGLGGEAAYQEQFDEGHGGARGRCAAHDGCEPRHGAARRGGDARGGRRAASTRCARARRLPIASS